MILPPCRLILTTPVLGACLVLAATLYAQKDPHIGYIYPAGAQQGTRVDVVLGGQFLEGVSAIVVSGGGLQGLVRKHVQPLTQREINDLRDKIRLAKQQLRETQKESPVQDPAETLAVFAEKLGVDREQLSRFRDYEKKRSDTRRQPNPQIEELVHAQFTLDRNAKPGPYDIRLQTALGLSNPVRFLVDLLPEHRETESEDPLAVTQIPDSLPVIVNGQILPGDVDRFRFRAQRNARLVASTTARRLIPYLADAVPGWFQAALTLRDSHGREVAFSDDHFFHPDPVLFCQIPADGFYELEIRDGIYRGREDFVYRISIGEIPYVTSIFPLGVRAGQQATVQVNGWNLPSRAFRLRAEDRPVGLHSTTVRGRGGRSNDVRFAVGALPECFEKEPNGDRSTAQRLTLPDACQRPHWRGG